MIGIDNLCYSIPLLRSLWDCYDKMIYISASPLAIHVFNKLKSLIKASRNSIQHCLERHQDLLRHLSESAIPLEKNTLAPEHTPTIPDPDSWSYTIIPSSIFHCSFCLLGMRHLQWLFLWRAVICLSLHTYVKLGMDVTVWYVDACSGLVQGN